MESITCPQCGTTLPLSAVFCRRCGTRQSSNGRPLISQPLATVPTPTAPAGQAARPMPPGPILPTQPKQEPIEALLVALEKGEDTETRRRAAEALGERQDRRAVPALIVALSDRFWDVRCAAASALGRLGDVQAVEPLSALLTGKDAFTIRAAAAALGKLGDRRAIKTLEATLRLESGQTADALANALEALGASPFNPAEGASGTPERAPRFQWLSASAGISVLTGLVLLASLFLPWFGAGIICNNSSEECSTSAMLGFDNHSGFTLAVSSVTAQSITVSPGYSEPSSVSFSDQDAFSFPLLWGLIGVSLVLLLVPLLQRLGGRLARWKPWVVLPAWIIGSLIELIYLFSAFTALPQSKDSFAGTAPPSLTGIDDSFSLLTFPTFGYWVGLLATLVGLGLYLSAEREASSSQGQLYRRFYHLNYVTSGYRSKTYHYTTYPIRLIRPISGVTQIPFPCPSCRERINLRVTSLKRKVGYRMGWAIGLLVSTALVSLILQAVATGGPTIQDLIKGGTFLCLPSVVFLIFLTREDGIRPFLGRKHKVGGQRAPTSR